MHRFLGVALGALALQSCAAVTTGTTQSLTVMTEPAGAQCRLTRGESATVVAVVNPTPNTLRIDKSSEMITIECSKQGFEATRHYLEPDFQAMTVGNAIIGGLVGVAVDAASGAMAKYPENAMIVLTPTSFASAEARDAHYARMKEEASKRWESWIEKAATKCEQDKIRSINGGSADQTADCLTQKTELDNKRQSELQELESKRQNAKIGT